jgi:hypothetical protein
MKCTHRCKNFQSWYKANSSKPKKLYLGLYPKKMDLDVIYHKKRLRPPRYKGLLKA